MLNINESELSSFPSLAQPWKKFYRKEALRDFDVHQKFNTLVEKSNCKNLEYNAINFMGIQGNQWTYNELFLLRDQLIDAFQKDGLKENDRVLIATVSGLEEPLCLMALNKMGAISRWVDITLSASELEEAINNGDCKYVVAFPVVLPELNKIIHHTDVKRVIVPEPSQQMRPFKIARTSMKGIKQMINLGKENGKNPLPPIPNDPLYIKFNDFLKTGKKGTQLSVGYDKDRPVLEVQSSGTTGKPKTIVHTDFTINNSIRKFTYTDLPLYPGDVMLKTAPAWVGYGLINTLGVGLAYGMEVLMTPKLDEDILIKYNQQYDTVFGVPLHYRYVNAHLNEIYDMSRPKALISGGDRIDKTEIINYQKAFATLGCQAPILNGAGNNEVLGAAYVNPLQANKPGTVGIPMYGDVTSIFDPDTMEEKKFGEQGEVCTKSDAAFLRYEGDAEKTNQVKKTHSDGSVWIHSGDLGIMDNEGYLSLTGRLSRVITVGAFKIAASQIEEVAQQHSAIKEAVAVAVPDKENGEVAMLFTVVKDAFKSEENAVVEQVKDLCKEQLKDKAVPRYYINLDTMPYTSNNKQDFKKLEAYGKEYVMKQNAAHLFVKKKGF